MKAILSTLLMVFLFIHCVYSQWIQKANFTGSSNRRDAVGFSIGDKGYIGTGTYSYTCGLPVICNKDYNDFWEYNISNNSWTRKADFGGTPRFSATGFSIRDKGYIGTGGDIKKDFWEYNPANDTWSRKADFPGLGRWAAAGFSIGNKGYIGLGINGVTYFTDFWEYDPSADSWTRKADFPGLKRSGVVYFSIGNKGYVGLGISTISLYDFWEYDPAQDVWKQIADFPGSNRQCATGFSIGEKGYVVAGIGNTSYLKDLWEWDSTTNQWTRKEDFAGSARIHAVGFSIGTIACFGTGSGSNVVQSDFWEYVPEVTSVSDLLLEENAVRIYPNPVNDRFTIENPDKSIVEISDVHGQIIESYEQRNFKMSIDLCDYPGGIYIVKVITNGKIVIRKILKI